MNVPKSSFTWRFMYDLAKPVHLPAGTTIQYTETYANSAANPLVVHYDTPNREVDRGELTIDEAMGGFVMDTVGSQNPGVRIDRRTGTANRNRRGHFPAPLIPARCGGLRSL
ncbi:MAG: hypothetical protein ACRD9L_12610 [Bryobacteraceae bacterium]